MKTLTISDLPPKTLITSSAVQKFWTDKMEGARFDQVTVRLPRQGPKTYLEATVAAALLLQKSMGPKRFHFTDKTN